MVRAQTGRKRDAARTRTLILSSAVTEFSLRGHAGTRVDEIASRAGVNKSLIYQYFGSKQELYAEALNSVLTQVTERTAAAAETFGKDLPDGDTYQLIRALLEKQLQLLEAIPEYPRLIAWENLQGGRALARLPVRGTYKAFLRRLEDIFNPLIERGLMPAHFDVKLTGQAVVALTHYFMIYRGMSLHLFEVDPDDRRNRDAWLDYCAQMIYGPTS